MEVQKRLLLPELNTAVMLLCLLDMCRATRFAAQVCDKLKDVLANRLSVSQLLPAVATTSSPAQEPCAALLRFSHEHISRQLRVSAGCTSETFLQWKA